MRAVESYLSRESGLQPAGLVAKGTVVPKALYALGRKDLERIWMWTTDDGVEVMADFDAFEVEEVLAEA